MSANTGRRLCYAGALVAVALWWPLIFMGAFILVVDYLVEP